MSKSTKAVNETVAVKQTSNFLTAVLVEQQTRDTKQGIFTKMVENDEHEHFHDRVAFTMFRLDDERTALRDTAKANGHPPQSVKVEYTPEYMKSYIQKIMNSCSWAARKATTARTKPEDRASMMSGLDWGDDMAQQLGVVAQNTVQEVKSALDNDFIYLSKIMAFLDIQLNYIPAKPLALYAEDALVNEEDNVWERVYETYDFDEAMSHLETQLELLQEQSKVDKRKMALADLATIVA
jgi:hypothetical protein